VGLAEETQLQVKLALLEMSHIVLAVVVVVVVVVVMVFHLVAVDVFHENGVLFYLLHSFL